MRYRRSPQRLSGLVALLIVAIAVGGFYLFVSFQSTMSTPSTTDATVDDQPPPTVEIKTIPAATPTAILPTLRIASEKAQLSAPIVDLFYDNRGSWDLRFLGRSAGYLQGTSKIGQGGNFVLAGHVEMKDGSAGPFARIAELKVGDPIAILQDTPGNPVMMQYVVSSVLTVPPDQIQVIRDHGFEELTLITCREWDQNVSSYRRRVVVHAKAINKPVSNAPTLRSPLSAGG